MEVEGCGGKEEADVLAGAFRRPNGWFRSPVRSRIEPSDNGQFRSKLENFKESIPGTSWVIRSFRIPMLHFAGRLSFSSYSSIVAAGSAPLPSEAELRAKKDRGRSELGVEGFFSRSISWGASAGILYYIQVGMGLNSGGLALPGEV